jgi:hypothetical protein
MNWWKRLWRRTQMEAQLEKELAFHLEQVERAASKKEKRKRKNVSSLKSNDVNCDPSTEKYLRQRSRFPASRDSGGPYQASKACPPHTR